MQLTRRETQVSILLAEGLSSKEIGTKLGISRRTVESHRAAIFDKLEVRNAVELTRKMMST